MRISEILTSEFILDVYKTLASKQKKEDSTVAVRRQGNMVQYNIPGTKRAHWWSFILKGTETELCISVAYYIGKDKPEKMIPFRTYKYVFQNPDPETVRPILVSEIARLKELASSKLDLNRFMYDGLDKDDKRMLEILIELQK